METFPPEEQAPQTIQYYQRLLRDSPAGVALANNPPRFSSWHWDDHERMKFYFGNDLDNLEHGAHQAEVVGVPLIKAQEAEGFQEFSYDEATSLVITNIFHDAHEGITGDLPVPDKDEAWLRYELRINRQVVEPILNNPTALEKMHSIMADLEGETFVGRAFKAGEICGYFLTGIKAWELSTTPELYDEERELCLDMAKIVCLVDWPHLQDFAKEFAFCQYLVKTYEPVIKQMRH